MTQETKRCPYHNNLCEYIPIAERVIQSEAKNNYLEEALDREVNVLRFQVKELSAKNSKARAVIKKLKNDVLGAEAEIERLNGKLNRYKALDKKAVKYRLSKDCCYNFWSWEEATECYAWDGHEIVEVWRGGDFEKAFCAIVNKTLVKEATLAAAKAKVKALEAEFLDQHPEEFCDDPNDA